jgi:hypothetical protein
MLSTASVSSVGQRSSHPVSTSATWLPRRSAGGDAALWVGLGIGVLALVALAVAATREPAGSMLAWAVAALVLLVISGSVLLWGLAYRQLTYALGERSLDITWLGMTTSVPYVAIDGVYTGQRLVGHAAPTVPVWPGIYVGAGRARGIGRLRFFATSPDPSALTLITLTHGGVVVSARNPQDFRLALIERIQESGEHVEGMSWRRLAAARAPWTAVFDRWFAVTVGSGLLLLLLMLAAIAMGFSGLPPEIPLRFDASGQATQIAPRSDLLRLPLIGFLLILFNTALGVRMHPRERLLARLVWLAGSVVQGVLLVAVIRLLQ